MGSMGELLHTRGSLVKHSSMMQSLAHRVRVQQLAQCTLSMFLSTAVLFTPLTSLLFQDGLKLVLRQVLVVLCKYHTIEANALNRTDVFLGVYMSNKQSS